MAKKTGKIVFKGGSIKAMLNGKLAELNKKYKIDLDKADHRLTKCTENPDTKGC
ncbi:hypothetical protein [Chryseobacterium vrystaatense]|uniref:hypothetical protein n=1 Tax=Chryseobacterium vrystaatense TaxID=307480 RepID=UPI000ADA1F49|nr:hypothetical protein [Chryseobacterium vrystaatense]